MFRGISISDYRSIGEMQFIGPFGKVNLFVGPKNSGKSNILQFINQNLRQLTKAVHDGGQTRLASQPHLRRGNPTQAGLRIDVSLQQLESLFKSPGAQSQGTITAIQQKIAPEGHVWIDEQWPSSDLIEKAQAWLSHHTWQMVWAQATEQSGGGLLQHWIPEALRLIRRLSPPEPKVFAIPIDRRAGYEAETEVNNESLQLLGGKSVIRSLAAMQNPQHSNFDQDRKRFQEIEAFVRTVTDDPTANVSVTHRQDEILVQMKGQRYLPLASLGSGVEQVILHAVAATSATNAVVTFEEPELHLHPVLQRQLVAYLAKTSNQYFISTHSAHLIDTLHADTFHVRLVNGETIVERAATDAERHRVCRDLGYRPSDIVQANCIIWVEGPSDRVYLRHWLKSFDDHLREHIHFSIMFYGGKLLSHLSAADTEPLDEGLDDLIQLRLLNRQVAVIIDSDLKSADDSIRETKTRVSREIAEHGGFVWVSAGREIENYVPTKILAAAVDLVAEGRGKFVKSGQYEKTLPSVKPNAKSIVDKVAIAFRVEEAGCDLEILDLKEKIRQLSAFIRQANGLPAFNDEG